MADFLTLIARMRADMALLHDIIHGAADQLVPTEGGDVPTAAKVLGDLQAQADALLGLDHNALNSRSAAGAHPMDAITGLLDALAGKADAATTDAALAVCAVVNAHNLWTAPQEYEQTALAIDAGTVTWDMAAAPRALLTLTEDVTAMIITNPGPGELTLVQDATGWRSVAWPASLRWPGGRAPEVTPEPGAEDVVTFVERDGVLRSTALQDFRVVE